MNQFLNTIRAFAVEDDGAQVVEYALVIALVSIGLALALESNLDNTGFAAFVARVTNCLNGTACTDPI